MTRLPVPGQDDGVWGDLLNDYLSVELAQSGQLKIRTDGTLSNLAHTSGDETIAGIKTFGASPIVPTPISGSQAANKTYVDSVAAAGAPNATTSSPGLLQLSGDLAGTATSPTVVKINGISAIGTPASGQVLTATSSTAASWQSLPADTIASIVSAGGTITVTNGTGPVVALDANIGTTAGTVAAGDDTRFTTITATTQSGNYIFALTDAGACVEGSSAAAQTFTIPPHTLVAFPVGTIVEVFQFGSGRITIAAGAGVTILSDGGKVNTAAQYATISLRQRATNMWVLSGDLA